MTKKQYTPMNQDQKSLCNRIATWCEEQRISHRIFAMGAHIDVGVWSKLRSGKYESGNIQKYVEQARAEFVRLSNLAAVRKDVGALMPPVIHPTKTFDAVLEALQFLEKKRVAVPHDEARGLQVLALPGMGKTTMAKQLAKEKGAVLVDASPTWWTNYRAPLVSICRALGLSDKGTNLQLELAIEEEVRRNQHTLVFHQVRDQTVSVKFINFLLTGLLEGSSAIVVLFAIPHYMRAHYAQADKLAAQGKQEMRLLLEQFDRRFETVKANEVSADDVRRFIAADLTDDQAKEAAATANKFGGLSALAEAALSVKAGRPLAKAMELFAARKGAAA